MGGLSVPDGIALHTVPGSRSVAIDTGWQWMHDAESRRAVHEALVESVSVLADAATRAGCRVIGNAVRPKGSATWSEWLVGDIHELGVLDDVEREVALNYFRKVSPLLVAMTGRSGVDASVERMGSRRLAEPGTHLATRYLASTSARHIDAVAADLRLRTGIRDLGTMDVHPLGSPAPGSDSGSIVVRCIDGQLFVGTAIAHAVVVQAIGMYARRLVRSGRRIGNVKQRTLENQRSEAIFKGIHGRVAVDTGPSYRLRGDRGIPRTESELLSRYAATGTDPVAVVAQRIADRAAHEPTTVLSYASTRPEILGRLRDAWADYLAAPGIARPASEDRPPKQRPPTDRPSGARSNGRPGNPHGGGMARDRITRVAALAEIDADARLPALRAVAAEVTGGTIELVPRLGPKERELVSTACRAARPPGPQRFTCSVDEVLAATGRVRRAQTAVDEKGLALITLKVAQADEPAARDAVGQFARSQGNRDVVLLTSSRFRDKDSNQQVTSLEVLVLRKEA
jgi:hypothetical protein